MPIWKALNKEAIVCRLAHSHTAWPCPCACSFAQFIEFSLTASFRGGYRGQGPRTRRRPRADDSGAVRLCLTLSQSRPRDMTPGSLFFDLQSGSCPHRHDAPARNPDTGQLRQTLCLQTGMPQNLETTLSLLSNEAPHPHPHPLSFVVWAFQM